MMDEKPGNIVPLRRILRSKRPDSPTALDNMERAMMRPIEPRLDEYEGSPLRVFGWFTLCVAFYVVIFLAWWMTRPAHATDHGFDKGSAMSVWMDGLKVPWDVPPKMSCCGKADAYKITILQDAIGDDGDNRGLAVITDGRAIKYPDGTSRFALPDGTQFRFRKADVNPLGDGNPTNTAWAFLSVTSDPDSGVGNFIRMIYCVIPLPPGY